MTYQDKLRKKKQRIEIIVPIVFVIGIFICAVANGNLYEGLTFAQSLKKETYAFLFIIVGTSLGLPLIFICIAAERAIRKWRNKDK